MFLTLLVTRRQFKRLFQAVGFRDLYIFVQLMQNMPQPRAKDRVIVYGKNRAYPVNADTHYM